MNPERNAALRVVQRLDQEATAPPALAPNHTSLFPPYLQSVPFWNGAEQKAWAPAALSVRSSWLRGR